MQNESVAPISPVVKSQEFLGTRVNGKTAQAVEAIATRNRRSKSEELRIAIEAHIVAEDKKAAA